MPRRKKHRRARPVISNYVVDEKAVADAIIARLRGSSVLVPAQTLDATPVGARKHES
jgi:hypothetical protein